MSIEIQFRRVKKQKKGRENITLVFIELGKS